MVHPTRRRARRALAVAALGAAAAAWAVYDIPVAFGRRPAGARAERVRRSPQFRDGAFRNTVPASTVPSGPATKMLREGAVVKVDDTTVMLKLSQSDVAVVPNLADYPAAVVHSSFADGDDPVASDGSVATCPRR